MMTGAAGQKRYILTYAGLRNLEDELTDLKINKRKEISEKIKEARDQGDISENAEYDAAKDEQLDIETRIHQIEEILKDAEIVIEDEANTKFVDIGCKVRVYDMTFDETLEYAIVGSTEANSLNNRISNESPVGKALMGAQKDEIVTVPLPSGPIQYKVLKIMRNVSGNPA